MKKKKLQKTVSMLLSTAILFSMVGCGNADNEKEVTEQKKSSVESSVAIDGSETDSKPEWDEITELTIYRHSADSSSVEWLDTYLREELGVTLVARADADGTVESTMLASGETADIMQIQEPARKKEFIEAGLLLDLSQYKEQLPSIFENENFATYIQYEMDNYGGVYGLSVHYGIREAYDAISDIRIDLYKELGYPEIKDMDELLQLLADMQKLYPETANGAKTYGLAMNPAWDQIFPETLERLFFYQQGKVPVAGGVIVNGDLSGEYEYPLEDNGTLYNGLKWFFKANQMGILDPDSPTLSYDEYTARSQSGRYMMNTYNMWYKDFTNMEENKDAGVGFATFYADCFSNVRYDGNPLGHTWSYCIGANTENLDAVLRFYNWFYSYEGIEVMKNGPEGFAWEYDENGVRVMTEEYEKLRKENGDLDACKYGIGTDLYSVTGEGWSVLGDATINPATGEPVKLELQYPMLVDTPLNRTVREIYGEEASYNGLPNFDAYDASGFKSVTKNLVLLYVSNPPDEITSQYDAIKGALNAIFYKMIFAADEAEFDALWESAKSDAEAGNYKEYYEAVVAEIEKAIEAKGKYFQ